MARRFEEQLERIGGWSYARVAEHFGVSRATVCYHISLLRRLPQDFVQWLESQTDPTLLCYFTEHGVGGGRELSHYGGQKWASYLPGCWLKLLDGKYGIGIPRCSQRCLAAA